MRSCMQPCRYVVQQQKQYIVRCTDSLPLVVQQLSLEAQLYDSMGHAEAVYDPDTAMQAALQVGNVIVHATAAH